MSAVLPIREAVTVETGDGWRNHLLTLAAAAAALLLLFHRDAADMVRIWLESSTYNHCILIPPIIGWMVWQRLPEIRQLQPGAWLPALALVGCGGFGWLLGEAGGVALARHAGLVLMFQGLVVVCLGKNVARSLAFPIFYAVFMIPAGEEIVPLMQTVTAHMCMGLLALVGIPAHLEGIFITTPTALFEVAEACSGVKFLVAMLAYGALVANLCFRSWTRRLLFIAASLVIPILANGVRAWGTIYVASLTNGEFAVGFDHVVYGWFFFALVIATLMGAGWRFFDRGPRDRWFDPAALNRRHALAAPKGRLVSAVAAAMALAAAPVAWQQAVANSVTKVPTAFALPQPAGWQVIPAPSGLPWRPHFAGADALHVAHYRSSSGQQVTLAIAVFARQGEGKELVGFGQGAVAPEGSWVWLSSGNPPPGGRVERIGAFGTVREVASFYRVGRILTGSSFQVKWETMKMRLLGGPQRAVAVLVSAQAPGQGLSARPTIDSFLDALGPVDRLADRAAGL